MAGVQASDVQFAEVHDCFTIAEIVAIEDLGFAAKGQGGPYTLEGRTCLTGERPVNTSGRPDVEGPSGLARPGSDRFAILRFQFGATPVSGGFRIMRWA